MQSIKNIAENKGRISFYTTYNDRISPDIDKAVCFENAIS